MSPATPTLTRRRLLQIFFLTGGAAAAGRWLVACDSGGALAAARNGGGELSIPSGPLANIGPLGAPDGDGVAVPEGFVVRNVARTGTPPVLGGTYPWHTFPDGGAVYARAGGGWIYTSNSEVPGGLGGCGALVFDADGTVVDAYPILTGTSTNCAGGRTPWETWLSCEEDAAVGQVWETDPTGALAAVAHPALGVFAHEAAVVDLRHHTAYLTEDESDGRFYRFVADEGDVSGGRLAFAAGTLQVMNIDGFADGGYPEVEEVRRLRRVTWTDVVRPAEAQATVRSELASPPGTRFAGGEGLWLHELPEAARTVPAGGTLPTREIVFFSTKGDNRIWALDVENQLVEVIFDNTQIEPGMDDVDNITMSPAGDILVAEDLSGGRSIRILVVVPNAPAKVLVEMRHEGSEISGPAFTPDGSRLYFSSQRGPNVPGGQVIFGQPGSPGSGTGATYELLIPEQFRR